MSELEDAIEAAVTATIRHHAPARGDGSTRCCQRVPFDLPATDRLTLQPDLVTCQEASR